MSHANEIRSCVEKILSSTVVKGFYPTYIQKQVGCPLKEVEEVLHTYVSDEILSIQYELICPDCFRAIDKQLSKSKFSSECECICGYEMEYFDDDNILIRYIRNPQYSN